jgi:peptidoglycan/LPS O-acetylase OafA/YrhL
VIDKREESSLPLPSGVQPSRRHIDSLDGLRGCAFLMVFMFHYGISGHAEARWIPDTMLVTTGLWCGVDLFFVLSGFLITGILLDTRDDPHYFRNFYARRALRIFPLFYGVLFLLLALTPWLHLQWRPGHLAQFFYLGNVAGHIDPTLNDVQPAVFLTHFWSLAVEEQFYLIWPLVVLRVSNRRSLLRVCVGMIFVSFLLRCILIWQLPDRAQEWSYGELLTHCDGLLCGAIAANLIRSNDIATLVRQSRVFFLASSLGIAGLAIYYGQFGYHDAGMTLFVYPLLAIFFTCILLRTIKPGTFLSWMGRTRFLSFFGKYSYGMYVYHVLFFPMESRLLLAPLQRLVHSKTWGGVLYVLEMLVLTCIVSVLSYQLYERHWLKLKSRFSYTKPKTAAPALIRAS